MRHPDGPQIDIKNHDDQMRLGEVVDYALNGMETCRSRYAFFLFAAPFEMGGDGCVVSNRPPDEVVPLMIAWLQRYAPGRISVNKPN